jgi:hypothetical protein
MLAFGLPLGFKCGVGRARSETRGPSSTLLAFPTENVGIPLVPLGFKCEWVELGLKLKTLLIPVTPTENVGIWIAARFEALGRKWGFALC